MLIRLMPQHVLIGSVTETSGHLHVDMTDASGQFFSADNDYSTYAPSGAVAEYLLEGWASGGLAFRSYAGAVGGGEALGADLLSGWNFTTWGMVGTVTIDDSDTFTTTGIGGVCKEGFFTAGTIVKLVGDTSQATMGWYNGVSAVAPLIGSGDGTFYFTPSAGYPSALYLRNPTTLTTDITSMTAQALTDVPVTGLHLFKDRALTTRGILTTGAGSVNAITEVKIFRC